MADRVFYRRPFSDVLAVSGQQDTARGEQREIYLGIVASSFYTKGQSGYSRVDGNNYGVVKVRILEVNQTLDEELLPEAFPLDNNMFAVPLIGELVTLVKIQSQFFYTTRVPVASRLQENGLLNLSNVLNRRNSNTYSAAAASGEEQTLDKHKFGEYFRPDSRVRQLMHHEGDMIFQGRMGHSIRFGSSKMDPSSKSLAPNIILRAGQAKDIEKKEITIDTIFGAIVEDINNDASSIWMVSDQAVPFVPSTKASSNMFHKSIKNKFNDTFDKAQIFINSNRLILNSKDSHILLYSNDEVYINSFGRTSIDSDESVIIKAQADFEVKTSNNAYIGIDQDFIVKAGSDVSLLAAEKISLSSKKIFLGSGEDDKEPVVGGTTLSKFLARLIHALVNGKATNPPIAFTPGANQITHVITPMGPGLLAPAVIAALQALYLDLTPKNAGSKAKPDFSGAIFNSEDVFVNLSNEDPEPGIVKNEYKAGTKVTVENSTWLLSDSYYKVV